MELTAGDIGSVMLLARLTRGQNYCVPLQELGSSVWRYALITSELRNIDSEIKDLAQSAFSGSGSIWRLASSVVSLK